MICCTYQAFKLNMYISYPFFVCDLSVFIGIFLLGIQVEYTSAKSCLQYCDGEVDYMTCPSSGDEQISPVCVNCCTAGEGCKLFKTDGSLICTGTKD